MTEDNKRSSKTIHVDTLHIKANEVIIHQERHDSRTNLATKSKSATTTY